MTSPNILLLHTHDLGRFLGCYGIETVHSPNLDALAASGALFASAFCAAPQCSPARAALFTGTYPQRNGVLGLTHSPFDWDLTDTGTHLASRLRGLGYRRELVGVHHEALQLPDDEMAVHLGVDLVRGDTKRDTVVANAVAAIDRARTDGRPFYLQVGFHEPHRSPSPHHESGVNGFLGADLQPDDSRGVTVPGYLVDDAGARTEVAEIQGAVRALDEAVGQVLAALSAAGLDEKTIVMFTTDHGLALPRAKCSLYDPGVEVALMLRAPGVTEPSTRVTDLVSHLDVVPTLLELIGRPLDDLPGVSLVPWLRGGRAAHGPLFGQLSYHNYYDPKRSIRTENHKLIANFTVAPQIMDPTQSWRHRSTAAAYAGRPTVPSSVALELYAVDRDPFETTNLSGSADAGPVLDELAAALLRWMQEQDDFLLQTPTSGDPRHRATLNLLRAAAARHVANTSQMA